MEVSIKLDHSNATFTNGDTIYGTVDIYCPSTVTLSKISVALAGESISTLSGSSGLLRHRKNKEKHLIVHDIQDVIPYSHSFEDPKHEPIKLGFGYHSFPFGLQVPWFAECQTCRPHSPVPLALDDKKVPGVNCCRELPPLMSDLVKGAEVVYRIDVALTVVKMLKETLKKSVKIKVWPLDTSTFGLPPTSFPSKSSVQASIMGPPTPVPSPTPDRDELVILSTESEPAQITIEASFPQEYALTCNRDIAMRLAVRKCNAYPGDLYLQSFQMLLVGFTDIRAQSTQHGQMTFWMIQSLSNLEFQVSSTEDAMGSETKIDEALWEGKALPDEVIPSFETCNLGRRYELEILMGFQCGSPKARVLFVQLRVPVRVSSGIRPGRRLSITDTESMETLDLSTLQEANAGAENGLSHERGSLLGRTSPPPAYSQAITVSIEESLRQEQQLTMGLW